MLENGAESRLGGSSREPRTGFERSHQKDIWMEGVS
jgi:hypothetical protein